MDSEDAAEVAALSAQLGYSVPSTTIRERYKRITRDSDNGLFVAEFAGGIVGWVHVLGVHYLESPRSFAEIGGLIVDENVRRRRIGQALMEQAEKWAYEHGYHEVRLRSGLHRTEAHQFYQMVGYTLTKTGYTFCKELS